MELVPTSDKVEVSSVVYHAIGKAPKETLFPAVTIFENELGGTVFTFCGTPLADYNLTQAFSFLSYSRKRQLVSLMRKVGMGEIYYPGDEEMYMKLADMPDGGTFVSLINISTDPIDEIELYCEKKISRLEALSKNGERCEVSFRQDGARLFIEKDCGVLNPVILFMY